MQGYGYAMLAVEMPHCYLFGKIGSNNVVQNFQPFLDGLLLDGIGGQHDNLIIRQVVHHVG